MAKDVRESREPRSGYVTFASGDSGTAQNLVSVRDEAVLSPDDINITYDNTASATATVSLYDDEAGTAVGDVTGQFAEFTVDPGDEVGPSDFSFVDVENDVVAVVSNNDGDISINLGGNLIVG